MTDESRQLVVLCDGTNNNITGGQADTNVLKLMGLLARDEGQLVFYDPGVGNASALPGATGMDRLRRRLDRLWGLAFGRGAYENIAEAYTFLMRNHQPGDNIFIFGFSRGAFTARAVAGLVNQFGILRPTLENLVPTLIHVYFSDAKKNAKEQEQLDKVRDDIRRLCAVPDSLELHKVWFVGVWDTVSSIGLPPFTREIHKPATVSGKRMVHVRQALALDEHRRPFRPRLYAENNFEEPNHLGQTFKQEWFSGSHCDVGGGYAAGHARLSDEALRWLVQEAQDKLLRVELPPVASDRAIVHSETQSNPWWAVAGLGVRDVARVRHEGSWLALTPVVNQAGSKPPNLTFPRDTAWVEAGASKAMAALLLGVLFYLLMGSALANSWPGQAFWGDWVAQARAANNAFVAWQLWPAGSPPGHWRATALLLDFFFIGANSYVLGWLIAPAFATLARLGTIERQPHALLNVLGLALMVTVSADAIENILSLAIIALDGFWYPFIAIAARCALVLAAWIKFISLAGAVLVAAVGIASRVWLAYHRS